MPSSRLPHSDHDRLALTGESRPHEVQAIVAAVGAHREDALELLLAKRFERLSAGFAVEALLGAVGEPAAGLVAVALRHGGEERRHDFVGTGRWLLRTAEAERSNQDPSRQRELQVPEQDGANSSSSAAETNSSLHQNDAREWPLRTHWSWSWQSQVSC